MTQPGLLPTSRGPNPIVVLLGLLVGWMIGMLLIIAFTDELLDFYTWLPTWNDPQVVQEQRDPPPDCHGNGCQGPAGLDGRNYP